MKPKNARRKPETPRGLNLPAYPAFLAVAVLTAALPCAASDPDSARLESVHMESLVAQSVGMERRFQSQNLFFEDSGIEEYLTSILETLAAPDENRRFILRARALRSGAVNAFASPHGTVYVCTGLLARITSEAQAAAVLAHEIAHVVSFHAPKNLAALKAYARSASRGRQRPPAFGGVPAAGVTVAALRAAMGGYSRNFEWEADSTGLVRMAAAGYPHGEFYSLFAMLGEYAAAEKNKEPYFFSSHPHIAERLENYKMLTGALGLPADVDCYGAVLYTETPQTDAKYQEYGIRKGNCMEDDIGRRFFTVKVRNAVLYDAAINLAAGRYEAVEGQLDRLLAVDSGDVAALVMRGDMERMLSPRSTGAIGWYGRALARDPDNAAALRAAGFAYHSIGDFANARGYLRKYCKIAAGAPDIKMAKEALRQCGE